MNQLLTSAGLILAHDSALDITPEASARIRAAIHIDAVLSSRVQAPRARAHWLRTIEIVSPFFGRTPLALLFRGLEGLMAVAECLATRRPAARTSESY